MVGTHGSRTKVTARWVVGCTPDGTQHQLLRDGEVVYEGNRIIFVGHDYPGEVGETIDGGNALLAPGFVDLDALFDLDSTVLGFDNHPGWAKARVWASSYVEAGPRDVYTPEQETFQHTYAMAHLLLNGITTALPIRSILYRAWAETYAENAAAAEAAEALGIRMYLGPSYRTGLPMVHPDGRISMHWDEAQGMAGLADAIRFVQDFDGRAEGRIRGFLQPDRIEGCTEALLVGTAQAAAELDCVLRLHCCQGALEVELVQERFGKRSLEVLRDLDVLSPRALLPHGTNLGGLNATAETIQADLELLAASGASIVHCPLVSARHGSVLNSFSRVRGMGIGLGMGTDTWPSDMVQNLHIGVMVSRAASGDLSISAGDYFTAATIGGADALGRADLGRLLPGALADMVLWDLSGQHLGQQFDPIQNLVLSGSGRDARTVIVDGRVVVQDRTLPGYDLAAMHQQAQAQYEQLMASYPERAHLHPPMETIFEPSFPLVERQPSGTASA